MRTSLRLPIGATPLTNPLNRSLAHQLPDNLIHRRLVIVRPEQMPVATHSYS